MIGWRMPALLVCSALLLSACAGSPRSEGGNTPSPASGTGGGYYQNDGPPDDPNIDLQAIPDAVPRDEPYSRYGNPDRYEALGKTYYVLDSAAGFAQTGRASWYGKQFHGRRTSSGEPYNMFKMTAAHKRLPIPSYVRVTNQNNGKQVIVRVNDRGPFHDGRIIDLSYVAARRLGVVAHGSVPVRIETVTPASIRAEQRPQATPANRPANRPANTLAASAPASARAPQAGSPSAPDRAPGRAIEIADRSGASAAATTAGGFYLQSGAFGERANAEQLEARLRDAGFARVAIIAPRSNSGLYRVQLGPYNDRRSRALKRRILAEQGFAARNVDR